MVRVVIHYDEHGNADYLSDGGEVDLLIIDERCPRDRVYLHSSHPAKDGEIDTLIGTSRIGCRGDMPGTEAEILAFIDGLPAPTPVLHIVKPE